MKSITVQELVAWRNEGVSHSLIDIREPYEREVSHIDGVHIPMDEVSSALGKSRKTSPWSSIAVPARVLRRSPTP